MDRREILVNDTLGQGLVRHDVPDVPLHGLSGIENTRRLVLPVIRCFQVLVRQLLQLAPPLRVPGPQLLGDPVILLLCLIHSHNSLDVVLFLVQGKLRNLPA